MDFDVFLCHNSHDKAAVKEIGLRLKAAGLKPWLDEWDLQPGKRWIPEIEKQIGSIRSAAVFVGAKGIGPWQDEEVDAFLREFKQRGRPLIPVILESSPKKPRLPPFLRGRTWVDFRKKDPDPFENLMWGITGKKPAEAATPTRSQLPLNNLPFGSLGDLFKGREDLLAELEKNLDPKTPTALVQAKTLSGLGGVGKTRLAIEYAYHHAAHFSAIYFVNADSEAELGRNFAALAARDLLDLDIRPEAPEDTILKEVKVALREHPGWLLILDNVDSGDAQQALRQILPLPGGQVLITSRLQHWPAGTTPIQVDKLEPKAAREYLLKATENCPRRADDEASADQLAKNLGYLPLALELTAAYVRENGLPLSELLAGWPREEQGILAWHDPAITEYPSSLVLTWSRSFEKLTAGAQDVLNLLAHLAPEPIPVTMLEKGEQILAEAAGGELELRAALADLRRYSLLSREPGKEKAITLHRLVQAVALRRIAAEDRAAWAERAVRLVLTFAPFEVADIRTWPIWDPLRPHAARVIELAETAGVAQPTAALMGQLALLLETKALYSEAEPLMRRALKLDEASLGRDHPRVASQLNNLAAFLQATNRPGEVEAMMRRALEIDESDFGKDHPKVALRLNNLAQILQANDRVDEAEPLMHRSLEIDQASLGKDHPNVARGLNNLALILQASNRFDEAEAMMRRALEINETGFGKGHPRVADQLSNLAQLLQAMNRFDEAEPLLRRALKIGEASFGEDHPRVALFLNNLATLLQATNRPAEAEPLMRRALAIFETCFGDDHPWTVRTRENLAHLLAKPSSTVASSSEDPVDSPAQG